MSTSSIILTCWIAVFILEYFVEWLLDILNINTIIKNRDTVPVNFIETIDRKTYGRSVRYTLRRSHFRLITSMQGRVFVIVVLVFHLTGVLDGLIAHWSLPAYWHGLVFLATGSLALGLAGLPASLYSKFVIEEEFGFNTSSIKTVLTDMIKRVLVGLVLLMALLGGLYAAKALTGQFWWLTAWAFVTIFQLTLTVFYPVIIEPLFNKFEALPEGELRDKLNALAERCHFAVKGVFVMDGSRRSRHSNAYFTGVGRFRRIVIFDTLISSLKPDELEAVLAHEIGHWKFGHIRRRLLIGIAVNLGFFAAAGWALKWLPLFQAFGFSQPSLHGFIFLMTFFASPIASFFSPLINSRSRKHEYQADGYAVEQIGGSDAMRRALLELGRDNLTNLTPHPAYSFWHYSHPALSERLEALSPAPNHLSDIK